MRRCCAVPFLRAGTRKRAMQAGKPRLSQLQGGRFRSTGQKTLRKRQKLPDFQKKGEAAQQTKSLSADRKAIRLRNHQNGKSKINGQEPYGKSRIDFHDANRDGFINVDNKHDVIKSGSEEGFVHVELSTCVFLSYFFFPYGEVADFERLLQNIERIIRHQRKNVVIGGDHRTKTTNQRGAILLDWILANGPVMLNDGDRPTFRNANGTSVIYFTAATEQLSRRVGKWRVEPDIENFSDHHNIRFEIRCKPGPQSISGPESHSTWLSSQVYVNVFYTPKQKKQKKGGHDGKSPTLVRYNGSSYIDVTMVSEDIINRGVKWRVLNDEDNLTDHRPILIEVDIQNEIIKLKKKRRTYLREVANDDRREELYETFKESRKEVTKLIHKAKKTKWRKLCDTLDDDIFGDAWRIVRAQLHCNQGVRITIWLQSIVTYASPVWSDALEIDRNKNRLITGQRKVALRCISSYHTVSADTALVLAGLTPLALARIEEPKCLYEDALKDTAEHTLFHCLRFEQITMETEVRVGERLTAENIVLIMMTTKDNWKAIADMMEQIVKIKEGEMRRMQTLE
ncbi:hypothetical protein HUJ04_012875 [Dendroctonus ponderosae]|nr:hypothetical protein HUJ04_012875 [Dendroctonus ponderosae]